jgi:putative methanogen marker protein 4
MLTPRKIYDEAKNPEVRIGIGAGMDRPKVEASIAQSNLRGLGRSTIFDTPNALVQALNRGDVDAAVRGTLDANDTMKVIKAAFGVDRVLRMALLQPVKGRLFFLAPVGVDEGWTVEQKMELIEEGVVHMRVMGVEPKIGVLSGGRLHDVGRHEIVDRTIRDAECVAELARAQGIDARHAEILIEDAVKECNFIIAPDGISGNLIFRILHLVDEARAMGAPVLNIDKVFVDTSRANKDYLDSIALASALAGGKGLMPKRS